MDICHCVSFVWVFRLDTSALSDSTLNRVIVFFFHPQQSQSSQENKEIINFNLPYLSGTEQAMFCQVLQPHQAEISWRPCLHYSNCCKQPATDHAHWQRWHGWRPPWIQPSAFCHHPRYPIYRGTVELPPPIWWNHKVRTTSLAGSCSTGGSAITSGCAIMQMGHDPVGISYRAKLPSKKIILLPSVRTRPHKYIRGISK